jgi:dienelactone hydrolase
MTTAGDPAATARAVAEQARDGRFAEVEERYAAPLRAALAPGMLGAAWAGEVGQRGGVLAVGEPVTEPARAGLTRVSVPVSCDRGGLTLVMSVDEAGRLHGMRLGPATGGQWTPPDYAVPRRFTEREVTVGAGPDAVPGTMSLPRGRRPGRAWRRAGGCPGVVLLGGGGPFDRDETSGVNKPLKDLAWGLASRGVAVLRFDKVTFAHPDQVAQASGFTVTDEYVPHAAAAVRLLQQHPGVDPGRVFVLGHSLGGRVAPRVAAAQASVAGLVLLAGDAEPMADKAVRVARYLAAADPAAAVFAEAMARQAALAGGPGLAATTPAAELPFGWPASFWLDLRDYDPVATAAGLGRPVLILQGGRDYQVTVADDLARWRAGLGHRDDVAIRVYEADNHLFFPGSGRSAPAEYDPPQHVDPAVVADIAEWLAGH